jgi:hypothetical protein
MSWGKRNAPELILAAAIAVSALVLALAEWGVTYFQDTFAFLLDRQDFSAHSFFIPHNEHIVVIPVAITKVLLAVFGMTSNTPEQVVMAITLFSAAILLFVWARPRVGDWLALIVAVMLLFLGSGWPVLLWPFENVFTLPVVFGIATLILLDREDRRGDTWACVTLSLAVVSGSLGVCFIAAAFIELVLKHRQRGWARAYVFAIPLLIFAAWYVGWGHEAEHHMTLHNVLTSPLYVMEGFASSLDSLAGLSTMQVGVPGQNDWGRPLLIGAIALIGFGQWRRPGVPRGFWPVAAAGVSYWLLAAFNFVPGREASATRYVYAGVVFVLLMAVELLRPWPMGRKALIVTAVVGACAIGPNLAAMKDGGAFEKHQSLLTRSDLAALEIARDTVSPEFPLASVETTGTASLALIQAKKWFEAVDRWGTPAYSPEELEHAPAEGRHFADLVLAEALPITSESKSGVDSENRPCAVLQPGQADRAQVKLEPGVTRVEVTAGPPAHIYLRRFATEEFPVPVEGGKGGTTTLVRIPPDRADQPWYMNVQASQLIRLCH